MTRPFITECGTRFHGMQCGKGLYCTPKFHKPREEKPACLYFPQDFVSLFAFLVGSQNKLGLVRTLHSNRRVSTFLGGGL